MGEHAPIRGPLAVKRSVRRSRVTAQVRLLTAAGEVALRLRDLSPDGALLDGAARLRPGQEVVLVSSFAVAPARVSWVVGRRIGLQFHQSLDAAAVAEAGRHAGRAG